MSSGVKIEKKKEEGQQGMRDSNSQHAVLETAALPIELIPFYLALFLRLTGRGVAHYRVGKRPSLSVGSCSLLLAAPMVKFYWLIRP